MKSPSNLISLARLLQIQKDNFIGEGGQEYCPFEVEVLIQEKQNKKANELVDAFTKIEKQTAIMQSSDSAKWSRVLTSKSFFKELRESTYAIERFYQ